MPVVMAKPKARITDVVMAITLLQQCGECQDRARTSVTAFGASGCANGVKANG